ncbi:response regulator [Luteimonas sp. e5]
MHASRILLIEDSADDAQLIAWALEDAGIAHELHRVETRDELMAALVHDDWLLAICDSRLIGFDGAQAHAWVRERLPRLPVLFCTGAADVEDDAHLEAVLADSIGWIGKHELERLAAAVRRVTEADAN